MVIVLDEVGNTKPKKDVPMFRSHQEKAKFLKYFFHYRGEFEHEREEYKCVQKYQIKIKNGHI
jgi:hypothetical protein